jgi:hypothetical protein
MFEQGKAQRSAVTISITGLGQAPTVIENAEDIGYTIKNSEQE